MLKLNKLLKLLLLKFIAYQLNILSKISNLRDFLFLGFSQLLIYVLDILFDLFLGLKQTLALCLFLREVICGHVASVRLRVKIALVEGVFVTEGR